GSRYPNSNFNCPSRRLQMPSQFISHTSTCSFVRIIIALLLAVLLVFPESVALAQDIRCTASTGWNTSGAPLPNPIETFGVALNGTTMYVIGGYNNTGTGSQVGAQTVVLHKSVGGVASLGSSMWQFSNSLWKD